MIKKIEKSSKKIKEESIINGYKIGNLRIVVQGFPDSETGRIIKGVFCTLNVKKDKKRESINFVFTLNDVPSFKKHIISMINQAILIKSKKTENKDGE